MTSDTPVKYTPEMIHQVRLHARMLLAMPINGLEAAFTNLRSVRREVDYWADDMWAHSGYDKGAVLAALEQLDGLREIFQIQYERGAREITRQADE